MPPRPGAPVCRYWSRGSCNKGNTCEFQHPGAQSQSQNSFAALGQGGGARGRSGAFGGGADKPDPYNVSVANIKQDLSERSGDDPAGDRPIWPFSAYAPGRDAPRQLLEGDIERSPEEMRVQFYLAQAAGRAQEYAQQEQTLLTQVNQQVQKILNNPEAARQYVLDGANAHPNRIDQCQGNSQDFPSAAAAPAATQSASAFGQPSSFGATASSGSAFGQPSGLGAAKPAFGAPSSMGQGSAFGAPSALGGGGGFGKPSALGGGGSAFGQASSLGQSNPFGGAQKPATFGQASQAGGFANPSGPAFGQPTFGAAGSKPAFGAPSQPGAFGQFAQTPAFGQASQSGQSAFGKPSQLGGAFGSQQPAQQAGGSAFGAPSAFGAAAKKPSPFAAAAQNQQPTSNPFDATASKASPFAAASQSQQQAAHPFATPGGGFASASNIGTGFGAPTQPSRGFGTAPAQQGQGGPTPTHWQGKPVVQDEKGRLCTAVPAPTSNDPRRLDYTRIWFPTGPDEKVVNLDALKDPEGPAELYEGDIGQVLMELYEFAMRDGKFKDGIMPEIPPRREWIDWEV